MAFCHLRPRAPGWSLNVQTNLGADATDTGGQLQRPQRVRRHARVVGHVSDHGAAAVDVPQRLEQQQRQFTAPATQTNPRYAHTRVFSHVVCLSDCDL